MKTFGRLAASVCLVLAACGETSSTPGEGGAAADPGGAGGKADSAAGPIATLTCAPEERFIRPRASTAILVDAKDAAGTASRNYVVTVRPSTGARVVQRNKVILDLEGSYTVECCARDADLCAVTAVQVGRRHPALVVDATDFVSDGTVRITGQAHAQSGGPAKVVVDDAPVDVDGEGRFSAVVSAPSGANELTVIATDGAGLQTTRHAWTISGDFRDPAAPQPDAAQVLLSASAYPAVADLLSEGVLAFVRSPTLAELINKTYTGGEDDRRYEITPIGTTVEGLTIDLEPAAAGIRVSAEIKGLQVVADAAFDAPVIGWTERVVELNVERLKIDGLLSTDGLKMSLDRLTVTVTEPDLDVSRLPDFILRALLSLFDVDIQDLIETQVQSKIEETVDALALGFARDIPIALPEPLWGTLVAGLGLSSLAADVQGLAIGLSWAVDGDTDPLRADAPGYWAQPAALAVRTQRAYAAGLSLDVLNALAFAAWQTGALDLSVFVEKDQLPEVPSVRLEGVDLFVDPRLPPVITAGDQPGEYHLALSAVRVDAVLETDLGVTNAALLAGARGRIQLYARDGAIEVAAAVESLTTDVLIAPLHMEPEPARQLLADLVAQQVLPKVADLLRTVPIPEADLSGLGAPTLSTLTVVEPAVFSAGPGALGVEADLQIR